MNCNESPKQSLFSTLITKYSTYMLFLLTFFPFFFFGLALRRWSWKHYIMRRCVCIVDGLAWLGRAWFSVSLSKDIPPYMANQRPESYFPV
ncbi:hypothetical protein HBH56_015160 [Parastagonospora nodorum]|uniref:Uncharacterized protein n=1 Tax=Phaeosphaeria nodorum (strain SN15 / ATCC MYA-4574 / FGSC 10173) TaxID=321614 RepID=A0A7U2EXW9_PHANO|nr:hypothetical protein HBH56_015160 [Parastagonospora nodorum]QRC94997.1 hypothetical protein JI435_406680 [Parastagonospora nodorum SN15]KAH3937139.1 hypothetical protein HBH54_019280 [Parastagonospora nodorum]KAH3953732.1 hypothetical protein HBH53_031700 [Parastagonospora nodorum]KAH3969204.1 hypothetical protein HBH51_123860 [Parastagonospora nodorum]